MNSRNQLVIIAEAEVYAVVSGSGPSYNVQYYDSITSVQVGDRVVVKKRAAGAGTGSTILSTYHYRVTAIVGSGVLTLTYQSDTAGSGDDSPADLYSGGGSSGSPEIAPHEFRRDLGASFIIFME